MARIPTLKPRIPTLDTRIAPPPAKATDPELLTKSWRDMRARVVREADGRCQYPGCGKAEPRMFVDHIHERRDGGALLDRDNLWCLCASHHLEKTADARATRSGLTGRFGATHPGWLRPSRVPLSIVCGPPASGKSTWARSNVGPGGIIIDLDEITSRLSGKPIHAWGEEWLDAALRQRNSILGQLSNARPRWPSAVLIVGEPTAARRDWWANILRPLQIIVIATPEHICHMRINADPGRAATREQQSMAVSKWWNAYTPRAEDIVLDGLQKAHISTHSAFA